MLSRSRALLVASVCAVGMASGSVCAQATGADPKDNTGQAQRPANPKQAEPESLSHNAEKPKTDGSTPMPSTPVPSAQVPQPGTQKKPSN